MNSSETNCTSPYTSRDYAIVAGISAVTAFISLLASCFVVSLIVLFKKWKFFAQRLVLYLAISVILESIATIIHRVDYENQTSAFYVHFCKISGYIEQNTSWMQLMAVISITVYVFVCAMFKKRTDRHKDEVLYLFFIFIFPLLFNWIPFIFDVFGRAGAWCWIVSENIYTCEKSLAGQILQFVLWYVPLYIVLVALIFLYVAILIKIYIHKLEENRIHRLLKKEMRSLLWYPIIYLVFNIAPLANRIHGLAVPNNPSLALWILAGLFYPLQGGAIALVFTLHPDIRKRLKPVLIKSAFKQLCQKKKKVVSEYPVEHILSSVHVEDKARQSTTL